MRFVGIDIQRVMFLEEIECSLDYCKEIHLITNIIGSRQGRTYKFTKFKGRTYKFTTTFHSAAFSRYLLIGGISRPSLSSKHVKHV